jgi:hypothetical protein
VEVTVAYPFPGCCPHSFNAHARDHCMACDCTKPPTPISTLPAPREPADTVSLGEELPEGDLQFPRTCGNCHALIWEEDREVHLDWHQGELDRFESITIALARLEMELRKGDRP